MYNQTVYIHMPSIRTALMRAARALLLAYALLYLMTFWNAEAVYAQRIAFQQGCAETGGFITLTDGQPSCTRLRAVNGFFQL